MRLPALEQLLGRMQLNRWDVTCNIHICRRSDIHLSGTKNPIAILRCTWLDKYEIQEEDFVDDDDDND